MVLSLPSSVSSADAATEQPPGSWQRELAAAIRDPVELCRILGLDASVAAEAGGSAGGFPLLVPRSFVARMTPGDPRDPLLLQVLPRAAERVDVAGYVADPLREEEALAAPGLVKKYAGRALLLVTGGCAVNCRYCFRREFPYADNGATPAGMSEALRAIAADTSIREVILSGGDPLLLDDSRLERIVGEIVAVPTVRRLRIHTRLPLVLPSRVTPRLVQILGGTRLTTSVVVHANHPAELDAAVAGALADLAGAGVLLFNQSVLLSGVNDSVETLAALSERLLDLRVVPYYLHAPDRVRGTAHFDVPDQTAIGLHAGLKAVLPGYAVPRLVREVPGEVSKVWIG